MVANPDSWSGFPKVRRVTLQATGVAEFGKYRAIGHAKHGVANCCAFSTLHAARCTLHAARRTLHAARCTLHAARRTLHAGRCTLHFCLPHAGRANCGSSTAHG